MLPVVLNPRQAGHATDCVSVEGRVYQTTELPERAERIAQALAQSGWAELRPPQDYGLAPIQAVHDSAYLDFLQHTYQRHADFFGAARPVFCETPALRRPLHFTRHPVGQVGLYSFGTDTPILEHTWEAAYWSAQAALTAAAVVCQGGQTAYALCRPPGHHAAADYYGGFCFLNNAAIAARFLAERVAILDIDYHHGNGTQDIFYHDPNVLYCSIHADPDEDYPYFWGKAAETGSGPGLGANRNFPLPRGAGDEAYLQTLESALACLHDFAPRYLVLSLGLDILQSDPEGGFAVSPQGLQAIARRLRAFQRAQPLPTVIIQEGGYLLPTLGPNTALFLAEFT